ncbi:MAG: hypothetical protein NC935_08150 [Candidatus Omnitrophica bacterium]|nr:hypothetical protein [Candidatus Omnitrophota bacterium]
MDSYNLRQLANTKKILENLKGFLPNDVFRGANIFVERALNPEIQKAKYIYPIYKQLQYFAKKYEGTTEGKYLDLLIFHSLWGFNLENIQYKILTSQEHMLIGSTPPISLNIDDKHVPISYFFVPSDLKSFQVRLYRKNFFVYYTTIGSHFKSSNNLNEKYYFLLEELNEKNQTKRDPRLIDFEKLLNLMTFDQKNFELADIDDIYNECKVRFTYSKTFPFLRDIE